MFDITYDSGLGEQATEKAGADFLVGAVLPQYCKEVKVDVTVE
jgi:hypothetical protein